MPTCRLELMGIHDSSGYQRPSKILPRGFGVCCLIFSQWFYHVLSIIKASKVSHFFSFASAKIFPVSSLTCSSCVDVQTLLRVAGMRAVCSKRRKMLVYFLASISPTRSQGSRSLNGLLGLVILVGFGWFWEIGCLP